MARSHLIFPIFQPPPPPDWRLPLLARYISVLTDAWEKTRDDKLQERIERLINFADSLK
jgi:hypothetical protein